MAKQGNGVAPDINAETTRIFLVEDDETIRETISEMLEAEGFKVKSFGNGATALRHLSPRISPQNPADLLILDLMLPGMMGLEVCKELRKDGKRIPILIISAKDTETDRILGLELGADDYLVKPFSMLELLARCRALLRRSMAYGQMQANSMEANQLAHGRLVLYSDECRVTLAGEDVKLSPKEFRLLQYFMRNPKRVHSREKLLQDIWGFHFVGDSKTVDVHIRWLREKIEEDPSKPDYIKTVRGFGYRFG
ncbi:MAG: response regulator transcription factor [Aphanocapsa feldmannii 277cV]|uniref:Response regulator transcription factor n=2 Tax=Aphanocapsa feldmannii TaxID=192050 RepID=A0A524RNT9_9CHRO|nr:MAG: response regulator transcription factor [Aphanocapsa feldmannii 288cV]TGG93016.1 MAG: response regulator transcription factor [Aphanocapsa feldmannii 277cV]TGH20130.1 MAG: response regulator transcription factor [Aphanocapsa feldmannii 277cI]